MKKFFKVYDNIEEKALIVSLCITVILTFAQVVLRYVFNNSLSWSEELIRYLFIWQCWLGISIGERYDKHLKVDIIMNFVKGKKMKIINLIAEIFSLAFCIFLVYFGMTIVMMTVEKESVSAALRIPLYIVYFALPFSAFMAGIRYSINIKKQISNFNVEDEESYEKHEEETVKEGHA